jgi:hypothetical protein
MHQSNPSNPAHRSILKLKTARKSPREVQTAPIKPQSKLAQKPGASWTDDFRRQMQDDMYALTRR